MNNNNNNNININNQLPASNDSDETANIGLASEDSTRVSSDMPGVSSTIQAIPNGHKDPKQRRIYLSLFTLTALSGLLGLTLLAIWMFRYRPVSGIGISTADELSNLHPLMMFTFMVSLNMYSVLVYRTHYSEPKDRLKWTHAILSGGNIVMSLLGVFAMYKSHLMLGFANFYSLHSWIGALTNAFYLSQFVFGFVAFMKPGLAQHKRAALMPWHRLFGSTILVLAGVSAITGILEMVIFQDKQHDYSKFTAITFIANLAGISTVVMTALAIYLLTAPQYLRPRQMEEEPLKR